MTCASKKLALQTRAIPTRALRACGALKRSEKRCTPPRLRTPDDRGIRGATHSPVRVVPINAHGTSRTEAPQRTSQSRVPIATSIGRFSSMRRACSNDTVESILGVTVQPKM